ncbi:MAG: AmmeMemoRadiSam system protein B [Armatimonadota bacterium]
MARRPAVAGMFYEGTRDELEQSIEECFLGRLGPGTLPDVRKRRLGHVLGLVSPHAGYMYSGPAAAYAFLELANDGLPDVVVLLGPNHHGIGAAVAVNTENEWSTPLGSVRVDIDTAQEIVRCSEFAQADSAAHSREHSIEVQLPFLQYLRECEGTPSSPHSQGGHFGIVPIAIAHLNEAEALMLVKDLGSAIARSLEGTSAIMIASTDFTHYESQNSARTKDALAMEHIINLDPEGLISTVYRRSITMCGVVGAAVMLEACKAMGATSARQLTYHTSGNITGDMDQVVGYGALSVEK